MNSSNSRSYIKSQSINRPVINNQFLKNQNGSYKKLKEYYGKNVFDFMTAPSISSQIRADVLNSIQSGVAIKKESAATIAAAVTAWAVDKGATHFCHWFQPLTGATAEKHDSFLQLEDGAPIEKLSASQLLQGEPDASSFPHGGTRSTFEARGYTGWDITSPMFLMENGDGKTLCIPTAFVSYTGEALDIKTPLLRSISKLSEVATKFLNLTGKKDAKKVIVTCGAEQEYFLIDKALFFSRPDLVMTGRTVLGSLTTRNQQLEDHYFGTIPERVLSCMEEIDFELHKLGIPAKTRHNEVAPAQFEIAPIFSEANVANDNNQLLMAILKKVAGKHGFVCLLHEKPFAGINGSGKHVNWSMADNTGFNLLEPGQNPHENLSFLAVVAIIVESLYRHGEIIRATIAGAGNDHRLGANEAPPSIISAFLGDAITKIFDGMDNGTEFTPSKNNTINLGTDQLIHLLKDNTDRNRTSPFAFTGNKFEFRAVGSSMPIGFPVSILNAAVAEVFEESNAIIEAEIKKGASIDDALIGLIKKWYGHAKPVVFNGDGYSEEWVKEAARRGLPNHRTTPEALACLKDEKKSAFITKYKIYKSEELSMRYNVLLERYIKLREIEYNTLLDLVNQNVVPDSIAFKTQLLNVITQQTHLKFDCTTENAIFTNVSATLNDLYKSTQKLAQATSALPHNEEEKARLIAKDIMPKMTECAALSNKLEALIPDALWSLPKFYDMLFLK